MTIKQNLKIILKNSKAAFIYLFDVLKIWHNIAI